MSDLFHLISRQQRDESSSLIDGGYLAGGSLNLV